MVLTTGKNSKNCIGMDGNTVTPRRVNGRIKYTYHIIANTINTTNLPVPLNISNAAIANGINPMFL